MNTIDADYSLNLTDDDYQKATIEVAFLLDAFASTIDNIMGGNTAPVGRIAGRDTAAKLPVTIEANELENVIAVLQQQMNSGFSFMLDGKQLHFSTCIIRQMCTIRSIEPGGALCHLFHSYFDGIINGLLSRPVKSTITTIGDQCTLQIAVQ